jgi:hypothetical protein
MVQAPVTARSTAQWHAWRAVSISNTRYDSLLFFRGIGATPWSTLACTRNSMDHGRVIQHEPLPIIHAGTLNPPVYSAKFPRQCGFFLPKLCLCTLREHGCTSSHRLAETVSHRLLLSSPCFSSSFFEDLEYVCWLGR